MKSNDKIEVKTLRKLIVVAFNIGCCNVNLLVVVTLLVVITLFASCCYVIGNY